MSVQPMMMQPMQQPIMIQQPMMQQPMMMQPVAQAPVIIQSSMGQQPTGGQQKVVSSREGHRTWSNDILDCCSGDTSCCLNCIFPCIAMCEISIRLRESALVAFCLPGGMTTLRARIRSLGGIQGSICGDYCTLTCCYCCALGQMERELKVMGW